VTFPSGQRLLATIGAILPGQEHWDPNNTGLPLLATPARLRSRKLDTNFVLGELVRSGGRYAEQARISPALVRCLQAIRTLVGRPVRISSGYRSWARNKAIPGLPHP
jgi:flagellar protein FlgJ